jgi:hypothetical protein
MGTGTRILATVAAGLTLLGGAVKVAADDAARTTGEVVAAYRNFPQPIKKALGKMAAHEAKDVIRAACQLKDSSNIEQQARWSYRDRGAYEISLIVRLAHQRARSLRHPAVIPRRGSSCDGTNLCRRVDSACCRSLDSALVLPERR